MLLLVKELKNNVLKSTKIPIFSYHLFLMWIAHLILKIENSNFLWLFLA